MIFGLTIEVADDTPPGLVQGALIESSVQFAKTMSFKPMDVDAHVTGFLRVTTISGLAADVNWTVHRIE